MRKFRQPIELLATGLSGPLLRNSVATPREALRIASDAVPDPTPFGASSGEFPPGSRVRVAAEDFALDLVEGEFVHASREAIAVRRDDPEVGRVHVHFPRLGYEVTAA